MPISNLQKSLQVSVQRRRRHLRQKQSGKFLNLCLETIPSSPPSSTSASVPSTPVKKSISLSARAHRDTTTTPTTSKRPFSWPRYQQSRNQMQYELDNAEFLTHNTKTDEHSPRRGGGTVDAMDTTARRNNQDNTTNTTSPGLDEFLMEMQLKAEVDFQNRWGFNMANDQSTSTSTTTSQWHSFNTWTLFFNSV